jgi:peptidoglycan/xylan/chitin deacetylase (PgdA/CDA1 family)
MRSPLVILGFDMETDVGSFTPEYRGLTDGTPKILGLLEELGIEATFYFTGHAAENHPEVIRMIEGDRVEHEIGCHGLYHETLGDPIFPLPMVYPLLPEEVPGRISRATSLVAEAAGRRPVSFRCPRLWGSTAVVNTLEDLGYKTDASYPLYFHTQQLLPYHPSRKNWLEKGDLSIWEIPNFADLTIDSSDPYGRDRDQWPLFRTENAAALVKHIIRYDEYCRERGIPALLCFYFHPWEFVPMKERYDYGEAVVFPYEMLIKNCGGPALRELKELLLFLKGADARFIRAESITPEDLS